jgi:hypothetical protein
VDTLTCPHCGMRNDVGDRVCIHCGKPTDAGEGVSPVSEERQREVALTPPPPPMPPPSSVPLFVQPTIPATSQPSNGQATASMVLGILGVALLWVPGVGFILAILAVVFGGLGLSRAKAGGGNRGQAIAGLVLGSVGIVLPMLLLVTVLNVGNDVLKQISKISPSLSP